VVVPDGSGTAHPTLSPSGKPGSQAGLAGSIPAVPPSPAEASFEDSIKKMQTKPAPTPWVKHMPTIAGGLIGGLLGGLIGFLLGGPVGMIIGAGIGIAGGAVAGHLLGNKLFQ
jgi:predicted lipid-binding transport protein (Tim44 family)